MQLGKAEHAVQGRAQFMAHIGEKLVFMTICDGELMPFLIDLAKQSRIRHGENRLMGEGLHEAHRARRKLPGRAALHDERAQALVLTEQRHHQDGVESSAKRNILERIVWGG
jgi:hypothetical protein